MKRFWDIVESWEGFSQGVFFLIVLATVERVSYNIAILFQGWPK